MPTTVPTTTRDSADTAGESKIEEERVHPRGRLLVVDPLEIVVIDDLCRLDLR